ncbi:HAD domain-containing protein [Cupriavidus basilensis]
MCDKYLFLDGDGVLHPVSALESFAMGMPRSVAVRHGRLFRWVSILDELLYGTSVQIIVHSAWRRLITTAELLQYLGPLANRYSGMTNLEMSRWEGILYSVGRLGLREEQWLVLDDHATYFPDPLPQQLVLCDPELGIWEQRVRARVQAWAMNASANCEVKSDEADEA